MTVALCAFSHRPSFEDWLDIAGGGVRPDAKKDARIMSDATRKLFLISYAVIGVALVAMCSASIYAALAGVPVQFIFPA